MYGYLNSVSGCNQIIHEKISGNDVQSVSLYLGKANSSSMTVSLAWASALIYELQ